MPNRFIFRQVYYKDLATFLADGEICSKNKKPPQACHQSSYQEIVNRRGTQEFPMPNGRVVNDYVPFYFSPVTSFTYTIFKQNVPLISPSGKELGKACEDDRIFFVAKPEAIRDAGLEFCFSDYALNSNAPLPTIQTGLDFLETHVHWDVFDEGPYRANIPEIDYAGVCSYFCDKASPENRMTRSAKRMAEFLIQDSIPLKNIECIIAKSDGIRDKLIVMMDASNWNIPVYTNRGCYFE